MKKLVLVALLGLGMLGVANLNAAENSNTGQYEKFLLDCLNYENAYSCQRLIDSGQLLSVEQCGKEICSDIGFVYQTAKHYQQAIKYYEKACGLNDKRGCGRLAIFYYSGQGVEKNFNKAFKFSKKACDLNSANDCHNVASSYYKGEGVKQDFANAAKYLKKACDANHASACNNLGSLYGEGRGVQQNYYTAKKYFGKACDLGEQMGCDNYKMLNK